MNEHISKLLSRFICKLTLNSLTIHIEKSFLTLDFSIYVKHNYAYVNSTLRASAKWKKKYKKICEV